MKPDDLLVQAWKQQLDAAAETHAAIVATRKAVSAATDALKVAEQLYRLPAKPPASHTESLV